MSHTAVFEQLNRIKHLASPTVSTRPRRSSIRTTNPPTQPQSNPQGARIAIIGAGLAGLSAALELQNHGMDAVVYEGGDRVGGRCHSVTKSQFPGQTLEAGGEFIDSRHTVMLSYVRRLGLQMEVMFAQGESTYYFQGRHYQEAEIVEEYRELLRLIQPDLQRLSYQPSAAIHRPEDVILDRMSLQDYLESRGIGELIKRFLTAAYQNEYGVDLADQSCLNLLISNLDQDLQAPSLSIASDERFHVLGGNQQIAQGLAQLLHRPIHYDRKLVKIHRTGLKQIALTFEIGGGRTVTETYGAAIITVPFTVLRDVALDASLELPRWKRWGIEQARLGSSAKLFVGFEHAAWRDLGRNGMAYSDLPGHQVCWEANPTAGDDRHRTLVNFAGGALGENRSEAEGEGFARLCDRFFPGAVARRDGAGQVVTHLERWTTNPLSKGAYTCYGPGQFTTIAGTEGTPIHNLHFAGEHTNSFYEWQGFMEGAARSGIHAAREVLKGVRV
jgi:monoamine oxidase